MNEMLPTFQDGLPAPIVVCCVIECILSVTAAELVCQKGSDTHQDDGDDDFLAKAHFGRSGKEKVGKHKRGSTVKLVRVRWRTDVFRRKGQLAGVNAALSFLID